MVVEGAHLYAPVESITGNRMTGGQVVASAALSLQTAMPTSRIAVSSTHSDC